MSLGYRLGILNGLTTSKMHPKLTEIYWSSTPSILSVKKWATGFKCGCTYLQDQGRPKSSTTLEIMLDGR